MKIHLMMDGVKHKVVPPYEGASHADVPGQNCPHCKKELRVQGTGKHIKSFDTYASVGICVACEKPVGEIQAKVNTLFGLEEDERVFSMGVKIY
jgi:hypothetical protein